MSDVSRLPADLLHLDALTDELSALVRDRETPRGVLAAIWLRIGLVLCAAEGPALTLRALLRLGAGPC